MWSCINFQGACIIIPLKKTFRGKKCEQLTSGFLLENQIYWKLEMAVFNHTVCICVAEVYGVLWKEVAALDRE